MTTHGTGGQELHTTLASLQEGLRVNLIETKRENFSTCQPDEEITKVANRNRAAQFDFLPVIRNGYKPERAEVIGLLGMRPFMERPLSGQVQDHMQGLSEKNLIGADASILAFVRDADQQKCRLVVSGQAISGLVSQSDLQRLPVRAALFGMVTYLELLMMEVIRGEFRGGRGWLDRLSPGRRDKVAHEIATAERSDALVDPLLFTQFADKVTVLKKHASLNGRATKFEKDLQNVQALRNDLAHANNYASSPREADRVCEIVRLIDHWAGELADA